MDPDTQHAHRRQRAIESGFPGGAGNRGDHRRLDVWSRASMGHPYRVIRRDALLARFFMGAPQRQRRSVERYNIVKRALRALARRYGVNPKTIAKWKGRTSVADLPAGPKEPRSTVLSVEEEAGRGRLSKAYPAAARRLSLCASPTIPHLTRSSHRCLQRHGISRLPQVEGEAVPRRKFKAYPIGYFISTSPRSEPLRASSISLSPSIGRRSSPSLNCARK